MSCWGNPFAIEIRFPRLGITNLVQSAINLINRSGLARVGVVSLFLLAFLHCCSLASAYHMGGCCITMKSQDFGKNSLTNLYTSC